MAAQPGTDAATQPRQELLDDPRITTYGLVVEAHGRLDRAFERSMRDCCDISSAWFEVLIRLARSPGHRLRMSELAEQLAITTGGVTRLVDRIAQAGYVERRPCPDDRRVQWVALTPDGLDKITEATDIHLADLQRELFDRLDADDVEDLVRIMSKLRADPPAG